MRILVDMDGVIANFEKEISNQLEKRGIETIPLEDRRVFYASQEYPAKYESLIRSIYNSQNFFHSFEPIKGGVEALREMEKDHEVFICSSPLHTNIWCVKEKYEWISEHLDVEWRRKAIFTNDKTVVQADYLIDDKPKITGIQQPTWEQIIYDQPYNRSIEGKRIDWGNWKEVIYKLDKPSITPTKNL